MNSTDVPRSIGGRSDESDLSPSEDVTGRAPLWRRGVTSTLAALGLALVVWVSTRALGVDIASPEMGTNPVAPIGVGHVLLASVAAALAGWAGLAVMERMVPVRARIVWLIGASLVLIASLGAPLSGAGITASTRVALVAMHLVVGGALIAGLPRPRP